MPDLSKLTEIGDALTQDHMVFVKKRCMPLKNTYSQCHLCVDACPTGALVLAPRTMNINKQACMNCGACTTVCPVEAFLPLTPTDDELAQNAAQAITRAEGVACFACARVMAHRGLDTTKVIAVECLSRVDESLLVRLVAHGVETIMFADGDCSTCKYQACGTLAHNIAYETSELLMSMCCHVRIQCTTGVPPALQATFSAEDLQAERRQLFFHTKDVAAETARAVAQAGIKSATGIDLVKKAQQASATNPERHDALLNALAEIGEAQNTVVSSRRFAALHINEEACTACQKCVLVCPTKALCKSAVARDNKNESTAQNSNNGTDTSSNNDEGNTGVTSSANSNDPNTSNGTKPDTTLGGYFEFTASRCVRCHLCEHVCRDNAIELDDACMTDVFNFEPTLLPVPQPAQKAFVRNFFATNSL